MGNSYDVEVTAPDGGVNMRCGAGVENDKVLPDMIPNGKQFCTVTQGRQVASNGQNSMGAIQIIMEHTDGLRLLRLLNMKNQQKVLRFHIHVM